MLENDNRKYITETKKGQEKIVNIQTNSITQEKYTSTQPSTKIID